MPITSHTLVVDVARGQNIKAGNKVRVWQRNQNESVFVSHTHYNFEDSTLLRETTVVEVYPDPADLRTYCRHLAVINAA